MGGPFSGQKKVYVSSVVYNLAGDETKRPDYLKTTVMGAVLNSDTVDLTETLTQSYLRGPGLKLRKFARWGREHGYSNAVGLISSSLVLPGKLNREALVGLLPHAADEQVILQRAEIDRADYTYWVDRWLVQHRPEAVNTDFTANYDQPTNLITLIFADGTVESFTPDGFDITAQYLYAVYLLAQGEQVGALEPGTPVVLSTSQSFPSTTGWTQATMTSQAYTMVLDTRTQESITYSDGRPAESSDTLRQTSVHYTEFSGSWTQTTFRGWNTDRTQMTSDRQIMSQSQTGSRQTSSTVTTVTKTLSGGVTQTTVVTVTSDALALSKTYRIDQQSIINQTWTPLQVLIYQQGTGHAGYDAFFGTAADTGGFFPFIPVRLDNKFISPDYFGDIYPHAQKAMKRSIGADYDDLIDKIGQNPSLGDIDQAYVVFGVSLNVKENACRRYIYKFFQEVLQGQELGFADFLSWSAAWERSRVVNATWVEWTHAQADQASPLFDTPEPERPYIPTPPVTEARVVSGTRAGINFDMAVMWNGIEESIGSGQKKPGAKAGELWFEILERKDYSGAVVLSGDQYFEVSPFAINHIRLNWQTDKDTWRCLDIYGLTHRNVVYSTTSVDTDAEDALNDGNESGFIIPLHEGIYRRLSLVDATQMSTACCLLVFNCSQVVKQRWYQTSWFKVLLVVAIIVVVILTGGFGAGGVGLLGTNAAVGSAIGFTGTAAIIAGTVANAIAAMLLTKLIMWGSTAIFGEKVGTIIGAVASMIAITVGSSLASGGNLAASFESLADAKNILRLTVAAGNGYAEYMQVETKDVMQKTQGMVADYTAQAKELTQKYAEFLGTGDLETALINPLSLVNVSNPTQHSFVAEPPSSFLSRTLLTGSEVADLSLTMLNDFTKITLSTDLPT